MSIIEGRSDASSPWDHWRRSFMGLGVQPRQDVFDTVMAAWGEPHRRYHTEQHLHETLALLARWTCGQPWPCTVALALFFHDLVYAPGRADNEERSAALARQLLPMAQLPAALAEEVAALVLATRHEAAPASEPARLLVDVDLAILGAPAARYAEYTRQVREEYAEVSDAVFYPRRLRLLQGFLARTAQQGLFHTAVGRRERQAQAQHNLTQEIAALHARLAP